jgi:hypothetical protein
MSANTALRHRRQPGNDRALLPSKSKRTRQAIIDGAAEFLWSHPFRDLTVGELMSVAGASRTAGPNLSGQQPCHQKESLSSKLID